MRGLCLLIFLTYVALSITAPSPQSGNDPRAIGALRRIFGLDLTAAQRPNTKRQISRARTVRGSQFNSQRRSKCPKGTILNIAGECTEPIIERRVFVYTSPDELERQNIRTSNPFGKQKIDYHLIVVNKDDEGNQLNFDANNNLRDKSVFINERDFANNVNNFDEEFDQVVVPSTIHRARQNILPQRVFAGNGLPSRFRNKQKTPVLLNNNVPLSDSDHRALLKLLLKSQQQKKLAPRPRIRQEILPKRQRQQTRLPSKSKNLQRYVIVEQSNPNLDDIQSFIREVNREASFRNLRNNQRQSLKIPKGFRVVPRLPKGFANQRLPQSLGKDALGKILSDNIAKLQALENTEDAALNLKEDAISETAVNTAFESEASTGESSGSQSAVEEHSVAEKSSTISSKVTSKSDGSKVSTLGNIFAKVKLSSKLSSGSDGSKAAEEEGLESGTVDETSAKQDETSGADAELESESEATEKEHTSELEAEEELEAKEASVSKAEAANADEMSKSEAGTSETEKAVEEESKSKSKTSEGKETTESKSETSEKKEEIKSTIVEEKSHSESSSSDKKSSDASKRDTNSFKKADLKSSKTSTLTDSSTAADKESFIKINISSIKDFPLVYVKLNENHKNFKPKN